MHSAASSINHRVVLEGKIQPLSCIKLYCTVCQYRASCNFLDILKALYSTSISPTDII